MERSCNENPGTNTDQVADAFIKGAAESGHNVSKVNLGKLEISDCRGCGACQKNGNRCVVQDDMQSLYEKFKECDAFVMASPLYFWSITGRLKCFLDRLYAISTEDKYPEKKTALLMTSGDDRTWTFDHVVSFYHVITQIYGGHDLGTCLIGGCTGCEGNRKLPDGALDKAYQFGKSIKSEEGK